MSRHEIALPRGRRAVIGWDPPLQTFFLQVHSRRGVAVWLGCAIREITTVDRLFEVAAPHIEGTVWANPDWGLREQLAADQEKNLA